MSTHDEFDNAQDDWTPEERRLLAALPRERIPPHDLKARTVHAVRRFNAATAHSSRSPRQMMALAAAATVIFIAGTLVGYLAASRSTRPPSESPVVKREAVANAEHEPLNISQLRYVVWY